jgi:hypothetical protein
MGEETQEEGEKNLYSVHGSLPGRLNRKKEKKIQLNCSVTT